MEKPNEVTERKATNEASQRETKPPLNVKTLTLNTEFSQYYNFSQSASPDSIKLHYLEHTQWNKRDHETVYQQLGPNSQRITSRRRARFKKL